MPTPIHMPRPAAARAWLGLGFRPFFLGAGFAAVGLMAIWLAHLAAGFAPALPAHWHAHEMLFGYAGAVIAGFLLTAAQNWTQRPMPAGAPLAALFALWLAARLMPLLGVSGSVYALVDVALFPAVALAVAKRVWPLRQRHNYGFVAMLLGLGAANALMHAEWLGMAATARAGQTLAVALIVLMMTVMGGRVIPSFTDNRLGTRARRWRTIEWLVIVATPAALGAQALLPAPLAAGLAGIAALAHAVRLAGWYTPRYRAVPLLWILHLGCAWIVAGFALTALAALGVVPGSLATHAFTAGAMGSLTLGMMARVALGHTRRPLEIGALMVAAFWLLTAAAIVRVFGPLWPALSTAALHVAGGLWSLAFALFVYRYLPLLLRPRIDGKPG